MGKKISFSAHLRPRFCLFPFPRYLTCRSFPLLPRSSQMKEWFPSRGRRRAERGGKRARKDLLSFFVGAKSACVGWRQKWKRKTTLSSSIPSSSFRRHICCYTSSAEGSKGRGGGEVSPGICHIFLYSSSPSSAQSFPHVPSLSSLFFHALGPLRECSNGGLIRRRRSDDICPHHPASPPPPPKPYPTACSSSFPPITTYLPHIPASSYFVTCPALKRINMPRAAIHREVGGVVGERPRGDGKEIFISASATS